MNSHVASQEAQDGEQGEQDGAEPVQIRGTKPVQPMGTQGRHSDGKQGDPKVDRNDPKRMRQKQTQRQTAEQRIK